ncbi:Aste57867_18264 [Aphanomyces stellatus]|uniref:Aste57867_18264 protein n=1 Tax=Aphanomyces stellatus TaxID=120398 RepID=A0A485LAI2_9STRA|nr:hypothetical protein As57867_018202 [Aphanomyces stellatus]VFT95001.1 Aste57867_18264 [Aphanomyces stellatus]
MSDNPYTRVASTSGFLQEPSRDGMFWDESSFTSESNYGEKKPIEADDGHEFVHSYRHMWPILVAVWIFYGITCGIAKLVQTYEIDPVYANWTMTEFVEANVIGERCDAVGRASTWHDLKRKLLQCRRGDYYDPAHDDCYSCPAASPTDRVFSVFWESQSDCTHLVENVNTRYITHVIWSFLVPRDDGTLTNEFQFWSQDHIKDCILQLRMHCVKNLVAIGGASDRLQFLKLNTTENLHRFQTSTMAVLEEFGFDGIDVDDETGNMIGTHQDWLTNHGPVAVKYLQTLRDGMDEIQKPGEPRYILSWDEFPSAWDPPNPTNKDYPGCIMFEENQDGWHRCYEPKISGIVDFVNVMMYNVNGGDWVYGVIMTDTLPKKASAVIPPHKLIIGACSGMGCVMSQPAGQEVFNAGNGSAYYGGTMLWSGTIDMLYENSTCVGRMGRAGNYGVKMPFRATLT